MLSTGLHFASESTLPGGTLDDTRHAGNLTSNRKGYAPGMRALQKPRRGELQRQPCRSQDRQYSLGACFFVLRVRCDIYNSEFGALFRSRDIVRGCREMAALTLSEVLSPTLSIVCEPCNRHGRYSVARLVEEHGDANLTELIVTLTNCPKARSASIHERCKAVFERLVVR